MFLRLDLRTLVLLFAGFVLTIFSWRALDPVARYGSGLLTADETSRCRWDLRSVAAAVEMYELDYNLSGTRVDGPLLGTLVEQGYLREVPDHHREHWDRRPLYLRAPEALGGVVCRVHGEASYGSTRPLEGLAAFTRRVAVPYGAGVLVTLLLQGLLARWRRGAAAREASLPEWFADPVFKPASKEVIADLGPAACCPVCSQHLVGDTGTLLECLRCATPHHLDCAGYTDRCGVYGCGEAPPAP